MKIVFLGATKFSDEMLRCLLDNQFEVQAVFMIPGEFDLKKKGDESAIVYKNSNFADLNQTAIAHGIPCHIVDSKLGRTLSSYAAEIEQISPDVILVLGWYYMVPKKIRDLAVQGALGIHASLLPEYAGGSPLVWALINGEKKTGITMFRFEDGVDDGDILAQTEIEIDRDDTIKTLYEKVTDASKKMLVTELNKIKLNHHIFTPQDKSSIHPLLIRTPDDGLIDWNYSDIELYNFVRAQTKPYPCAFSFINGEKIKFISIPFPEKKEGELVKYSNGEIVALEKGFHVRLSNNLVKIGRIEVGEAEMTFDEFCKTNCLSGKIFKDK